MLIFLFLDVVGLHPWNLNPTPKAGTSRDLQPESRCQQSQGVYAAVYSLSESRFQALGIRDLMWEVQYESCLYGRMLQASPQVTLEMTLPQICRNPVWFEVLPTHLPSNLGAPSPPSSPGSFRRGEHAFYRRVLGWSVGWLVRV